MMLIITQNTEDYATELAFQNSDVLDFCMVKALHLEVNQEDVEELVGDHVKDLTICRIGKAMD